MSIARCVLLALAAMLFQAQVAAIAADSSAGSLRAAWPGFGGDTKPAAKTKKTSNTTGASKTPQVIKSITDAPKRLVSSTKSMLTPKSSTTAKRSGTTSGQSSKNSQDAKPGFFKSLLNPEPPPPPRTIQDWMKLKQIHP